MQTREIEKEYADPLDIIWVSTAAALSMRIRRDDAVFAAWDGCGELTIGSPETLDADDSLAQMVFHEVCHWMVEGLPARKVPDWGLEVPLEQRVVHEHVAHEHACLRLQAAISSEFGLREFLATTTDFRSYYDSLPAAEPLTGVCQNPALEADAQVAKDLAQRAWQRWLGPPWQEPLGRALRATRQLIDLVHDFAGPSSLWKC